MFRRRLFFLTNGRPSGLEVPACLPCNKGTSNFDQMAGVSSRVSEMDPPQTDRAEFKSLVANVHSDFPGWRAELSGDTSSAEQSLRAIYRDDRDKVAGVTVGPITKSCFEMMAAKFGFAIHYDKTGVIVPPGGAVEVRFRTNFELHETSLPDRLVRELGPTQTLTQGSFNVGEYFSYRSTWYPDGRAGMYVCRVGIAFTTVSIVLANAKLAEGVLSGRRFRPGDFKPNPP